MTKLYCTIPNKVLTKGKFYVGVPVLEAPSSSAFMGFYKTEYIECEEKVCTAFRMKDNSGNISYQEKDRFIIQ